MVPINGGGTVRLTATTYWGVVVLVYGPLRLFGVQVTHPARETDAAVGRRADQAGRSVWDGNQRPKPCGERQRGPIDD